MFHHLAIPTLIKKKVANAVTISLNTTSTTVFHFVAASLSGLFFSSLMSSVFFLTDFFSSSTSFCRGALLFIFSVSSFKVIWTSFNDVSTCCSLHDVTLSSALFNSSIPRLLSQPCLLTVHHLQNQCQKDTVYKHIIKRILHLDGIGHHQFLVVLHQFLHLFYIQSYQIHQLMDY